MIVMDTIILHNRFKHIVLLLEFDDVKFSAPNRHDSVKLALYLKR